MTEEVFGTGDDRSGTSPGENPSTWSAVLPHHLPTQAGER